MQTETHSLCTQEDIFTSLSKTTNIFLTLFYDYYTGEPALATPLS